MAKNHLLIEEQPLVLLPTLAKVLGVEMAIVLQQIHFYLQIPKCGKVLEGERWIWNTYEEWQEQCFPFWSQRTIRRLMTEAEQQSLLVSIQPEGRESRRKYYRVNYGMTEKLTKELADSIDIESESRSGQKARIGPEAAKKRASEAAKNGASCAGASISSETSTENPPAVAGAAGADSQQPEPNPLKTPQDSEAVSRAAAPPAAKTPHQALVDDWCAYYSRRNNGDRYPFGPRDAQAAKRLLTHFKTLAEVKIFIKACHARSAEGYPFGSCETLYDIANGIARLQAALATPPKAPGRTGHRPPAPQPHVTLV